MRAMIFIFLIQAFAFSAWAEEVALSETLNSEAAIEIEEIAKSLFRSCPPEKCILVSLGQSSVVLDSFLRVLAAEKFPDVRYVFEVPYQRIAKLEELQETVRNRAIDAMTPNQEEIAGRQVVVIRTMWRGFSMAGALPYIVGRWSKTLPNVPIGGAFVVEYRSDVSTVKDLMKRSGVRGYRKIFWGEKAVRKFAIRRPKRVPLEPIVSFDRPIEKFHRYKPINVSWFTEYFQGKKIPVINSFEENSEYTKLDEAVAVKLASEPPARWPRLNAFCKKLLKRAS